MYEYYTTPVEPQERVRTMETLNMSERFTTTTDDVYEVYIKRKDVKHKWIQTEDFDQGNDGLLIRFSSLTLANDSSLRVWKAHFCLNRIHSSPFFLLISFPTIFKANPSPKSQTERQTPERVFIIYVLILKCISAFICSI